jgi:hypothetical protein
MLLRRLCPRQIDPSALDGLQHLKRKIKVIDDDAVLERVIWSEIENAAITVRDQDAVL